jgi:hypothetical protein
MRKTGKSFKQKKKKKGKVEAKVVRNPEFDTESTFEIKTADEGLADTALCGEEEDGFTLEPAGFTAHLWSNGYVGTEEQLQQQVEEGRLFAWPEKLEDGWGVCSVSGVASSSGIGRTVSRHTSTALNAALCDGTHWRKEDPTDGNLAGTHAAAAALTHIQKYDLLQVRKGFISHSPLTTPHLPYEDRGLSLPFFSDFKREFCIPDGMRAVVVQQIVRFLTAGTGRSFGELMHGKRDREGKPYVGRTDLFISHYSGYVFSEDVDAISGYEASAQRSHYSFMDLFAVDQNSIGGGSRNDANEFRALRHVVYCAKTTLLVLSPWHDPGVAMRLWCLLEIAWTLKLAEKGVCTLRVALSAKQDQDFRLALQGEHPNGFGPSKVLGAFADVDTAKAGAAREADKVCISKQFMDMDLTGMAEVVGGGNESDGSLRGVNRVVRAKMQEHMVALALEAAAPLMARVLVEKEELRRQLSEYFTQLRPTALKKLLAQVPMLVERHGGNGQTPSRLVEHLRQTWPDAELTCSQEHQNRNRIMADDKSLPRQVTFLHGTSKVLLGSREYGRALEHARRAFVLAEVCHGGEAKETAAVLLTVGLCLEKCGFAVAASKHAKRAIWIYDDLNGPGDLATAACLVLLARVCVEVNERGETSEQVAREGGVLLGGGGGGEGGSKGGFGSHSGRHNNGNLSPKKKVKPLQKEKTKEQKEDPNAACIEYAKQALAVLEEHGLKGFGTSGSDGRSSCSSRRRSSGGTQLDYTLVHAETRADALYLCGNARLRQFLVARDSATPRNNLGYDAMWHYCEQLKVEERNFGVSHARTAVALSAVGAVYDALGDLPISLRYKRRALKVLELVYGELSNEVAAACSQMGKLHLTSREYHKAVEYYRRSLAAYLSAMGPGGDCTMQAEKDLKRAQTAEEDTFQRSATSSRKLLAQADNRQAFVTKSGVAWSAIDSPQPHRTRRQVW